MNRATEKTEAIANTLVVPLASRIAVSKAFPECFRDEKALTLEKYLPEDAGKGASEYTDLAAAARCRGMDRMVSVFTVKNEVCNIVYLGAGLDTGYDRLSGTLSRDIHWYAVDLPQVIEARREVLGERERETLIGGDMFALDWAKGIDAALPTLLVVSGVFQYFHEEKVVAFIRECGRIFPNAEMIFDATSESGLKFTNWFIRRTGNTDALMYFYVNDGKAFAEICGARLVEVRTFYPEALKILRRKISLVTKVSMQIAEKKKQAILVHLAL